MSEEKFIDDSDWEDSESEKNPAPSLNNIDKASLTIQKKERYKQDTEHRKGLVKWVKRTVSLWLLAVVVILSMVGVDWMSISDTVLSILLGTTTVNVLGLSYIVLKGLFRPQ